MIHAFLQHIVLKTETKNPFRSRLYSPGLVMDMQLSAQAQLTVETIQLLPPLHAIQPIRDLNSPPTQDVEDSGSRFLASPQTSRCGLLNG